MEIILQNHQSTGRPRPTRQLCRGKSYRINLDVLLIDGELDTSMVNWCRHRLQDGATLILMADRGREYARTEARYLGIESLFSW